MMSAGSSSFIISHNERLLWFQNEAHSVFIWCDCVRHRCRDVPSLQQKPVQCPPSHLIAGCSPEADLFLVLLKGIAHHTGDTFCFGQSLEWSLVMFPHVWIIPPPRLSVGRSPYRPVASFTRPP